MCNLMSVCIFMLSGFVHFAVCDIYLHNPRGSNNRLDEAGRERNNANRLFDSQNNNRGGYNVGSLYYYGTSVLQIEWTSQHSCGSPNSHCELILQYMCGDLVRDGANTTSTIPDSHAKCKNNDCNSDLQYGMHENYDSYLMCKTRERNKGLFTADQNLNNKNTAIYTRQNPAGTRRGYECPEERDYYPYWHDSPWIDIAVMTNNVSRCQFYQSESQNVKERWACILPMDSVLKYAPQNLVLPNNKEACEKFRWPANDANGLRAEWHKFPAHGVPTPSCQETEFSRDNHLGNGLGGQPNVFNWTVPNIDQENCVLRVRYNVSTNDYDGWNTTSNQNAISNRLNNGSLVNLAAKYGFESDAVARSRGYIFKNDPEIKLFGDASFTLRLALDTSQYGRVFQDRSHVFAIRPRPETAKGTIYNLNVRGKRGNIVQVYPAVEYDFVPNTLELSTADMVHIQWTGSNTNPQNNDGEGRAGTDRSNIVLLNSQKYPEGTGWSFGPGDKFGHYGVNYPMHLNNVSFLGFSRSDMETLAFLDPGQFRGEMSELDYAGTYFDLGLRSVTSPAGIYYYMSTRNNNFSNRDQKGRIIIYSYPVALGAVGANGGIVSFTDGSFEVIIAPGIFQNLTKIRIEQWTVEQAEEKMKTFYREMNVGSDYASNYFLLSPEHLLSPSGGQFTTKLKVNADKDVTVYRSTSTGFATWVPVAGVSISDGFATFQTAQGGVYVARKTNENVGMIVGITIACIVIVALVAGTFIYFRRHPSKWQAVQTTCKNIGRSLRTKV